MLNMVIVIMGNTFDIPSFGKNNGSHCNLGSWVQGLQIVEPLQYKNLGGLSPFAQRRLSLGRLLIPRRDAQPHLGYVIEQFKHDGSSLIIGRPDSV